MRGADVNHMSRKLGVTPLLYALKKAYPVKIIKFLLEYGADPSIRNSDG